jgi:hypothetical protein
MNNIRTLLGKRNEDDFQLQAKPSADGQDRWGFKATPELFAPPPADGQQPENDVLHNAQNSSLTATIENIIFPSALPTIGFQEQVVRRNILARPFKFALEEPFERNFPEKAADIISNDPSAVIEVFMDLGVICFVSRNSVTFWKFLNLGEDESKLQSFEFPEIIRAVMLCKIEGDQAYFIVCFADNRCQLFFLNRSFEFLDTHQSVLMPPVSFHYYNNQKNDLILFDETKNVHALKVSSRDHKIQLLKASKGTAFFKRIKKFTGSLSLFRQKVKDYDLRFRTFGDYIFALRTKTIRSNEMLVETRQKLYVFKYVSESRIELYKSIVLKDLLKQSNNLAQYNYEMSKLLTQHSIISDFFFDPQRNACQFLLSHGYEVAFQLATLSIDHIEEFKFDIFDMVNHDSLRYTQYLSKDMFTIANKDSSYVLNKKLAPSLQADLHDPGAYTLIAIPEYMNSLVMKFELKQIRENTFNSHNVLLLFGQHSVYELSLRSSKDLLSDVFTFEYLHENSLDDRFYKFLLSIIYELSVDKFCRILHKILMENFPKCSAAYIECLEKEFLSANNKPTHRREISVSLSAFHNSVLKYLLIFGEISSKAFRLLYETKNLEGLIKFTNEFLNKTVEYNLLLKDLDTKSRSLLSLFKKSIDEVAGMQLIEAHKAPVIRTETKRRITESLKSIDSMCNYIEYSDRVLAKDPQFQLKTIRVKDKFVTYLHMKPLFHESFMTGKVTLVNKEVERILFRSLNVFAFLNFLITNFNRLTSVHIQIFQKLQIKELIFDTEKNSLIKELIVRYFSELPSIRPKFVEYFFTQREIEALQALQGMTGKDFHAQDEFSVLKRNKLKGSVRNLEFKFFRMFYHLFEDNDAFVMFVELIVNRSEYLSEQLQLPNQGTESAAEHSRNLAEMQEINLFIYIVITKLLENETTVRTPLWKKVFTVVQKNVKGFWKTLRFTPKYEPVIIATDRSVNIEVYLSRMDPLKKLDIVEGILKIVTQSNVDWFRENCLKLILISNRPELLDSVDYHRKQQDLINISSSEAATPNSVGKKNFIYLIKYFISEKNSKNAIDLVLKISAPDFHENNYWRDFARYTFEDWMGLSHDESKSILATFQAKLSQNQTFNLDELKSHLLEARDLFPSAFAGEPTLDSSNYLGKINAYLQSTDRNLLTLNELLIKRSMFQSMLDSERIEPNRPVLSLIVDYYQYLIIYLQFNIHIPPQFIIDEVWNKHKLFLSQLELALKAEGEDNIVMPLMVKYIDEKGVFSSRIQIQDFETYFEVDLSKINLKVQPSVDQSTENQPNRLETNRDAARNLNIKLFSAKTNLVETTNLQEMVDSRLIYPFNLHDEFLKTVNQRLPAMTSTDLFTLVKKVEFYNAISEAIMLRSDTPEAFSLETQQRRSWFVHFLRESVSHSFLYKLLKIYSEVYGENVGQFDSFEAISGVKVRFAVLLSHQIFEIARIILSNMSEYQTHRQTKYLEPQIYYDYIDNYNELRNILEEVRRNIQSSRLRLPGYTPYYLEAEITKVRSLAEKLLKSHQMQVMINRRLANEVN